MYFGSFVRGLNQDVPIGKKKKKKAAPFEYCFGITVLIWLKVSLSHD